MSARAAVTAMVRELRSLEPVTAAVFESLLHEHERGVLEPSDFERIARAADVAGAVARNEVTRSILFYGAAKVRSEIQRRAG